MAGGVLPEDAHGDAVAYAVCAGLVLFGFACGSLATSLVWLARSWG